MRKVLILLLWVPFCLSQNNPTDEPIRFRGGYVGEPLSDYVDCSGKPKPLKDGYKLHGKICEGKRGLVYHESLKGILNPKDQGERFWFEKRELFKIEIMIPNEDWAKVRYDITEKMGEPLSEVPQVYQNGFGARWEYDHGFWVKHDVVVYAGIKVLPVHAVFGGGMATDGIRVTVISADRAKLPDRTPSTMD